MESTQKSIIRGMDNEDVVHMYDWILLRHKKASLVTQMVKNLLAVRKTRVWSLGWKDPL